MALYLAYIDNYINSSKQPDTEMVLKTIDTHYILKYTVLNTKTVLKNSSKETHCILFLDDQWQRVPCGSKSQKQLCGHA